MAGLMKTIRSLHTAVGELLDYNDALSARLKEERAARESHARSLSIHLILGPTQHRGLLLSPQL